MARIRTYEAPQKRIQPTDRGFHALIQGASRAGQMARVTQENITEGFREIGSGLERAQERQYREGERAQRAQDRQDRLDEKQKNEAARQFKTADQVKGHMEINQGRVSRAEMLNDFNEKWNHILATTPPDQIPAARAQFMRDTVQPAMETWRDKFSSEYGTKWADQAISQDQAHMTRQSQVDIAHSMGHSMITSTNDQVRALEARVLANPEDYQKALDELHHGHDAAMSMTPAGGRAFGTSAAEVNDDQLTVFRTLEGNANGNADHAVSPAGAVGRNQIMPATARAYGFDPSKLQDPAYNDTVAKSIIADLSKRYNGDPKAMFIAYNAGPGTADRWLQGGKNDAMLPGETQRYVANAQQHGFIDRTGGVGPNLADQEKLDKVYQVAENRLAVARVYGMAKTNPDAARAELADPTKYTALTIQQREALGKAVEGQATLNQREQKYSAANTERNSQQASELRSLQYLRQVQQNGGQAPDNWLTQVAHDPELRGDEKQALVDMVDRIHKGDGQLESTGTSVQTAAQKMTNPNAENKIRAVDIINSIAQPKDYTVDTPSGPIAGPHLSPHDAEMLLGHVDPYNQNAAQQMEYLATGLDQLHQKLVPANPDGSPNAAGERAFDVAATQYSARYRAGLAKNLTPEQMANPGDPNYLLGKNDAWVQQFAPGHEHALQAAREANPSDAQATGVELEDVMRGTGLDLPEGSATPPAAPFVPPTEGPPTEGPPEPSEEPAQAENE